MRSVRPEIRLSSTSDYSGIISLEQAIWGDAGIPALTESDLEEWHSAHPEGMLTAVKEGRVCGFAYFVLSNFFGSETNWQHAATADWRCGKHVPDAPDVWGVSVVAKPMTGAGKLLFDYVLQWAQAEHKRSLVVFARMPGLNAYARRFGLSQEACAQRTVVAQYATGCVRHLGSCRVAKCLQDDCACTEPLPLPEQQDPVLCHFAQLAGFGLEDVAPSAFEDPQSLNWAAVLARKFQYQ